jgi:heat shock protein HslJ
MRHEQPLRAILILVLGTALAGGADEAPAQGIEGTSWILYELAGELDGLEPAVTLVIGDEGSVEGTDGCNWYKGQYEVRGSKVRFGGNVAKSMRACPEPQEQRAGAWHHVLKDAASFRLAGSELVLENEAGESLATLRAARTSIEGIWSVVGYNNGEHAVVSVLPETELTVRFGENARVTGMAGCNRYFADYQVRDGAISIGAVGTTRMACPDPEGVMEQESAFLAALENSATLQLGADRLTLRSAGGSTTVDLVVQRESRSPDSDTKIKFDRGRLNEEGLQGYDDGLRALHYEYCIPDREDLIEKVTALDPTLQIQGESPGRIGCGDGELLCLGNTHQDNWQKTLAGLAAVPEIREIREAVFE